MGVAFLLSQLGAHASEQFSTALGAIGLTAPVAGILRILKVTPDLSQQELAARLGLAPSRLVAIVDDLEERGWVNRERGTTDRRVNRLVLTEAGQAAFGDVATVARAHESRVTAALSEDERNALRDLLAKVASQQGLSAGVHPGYRSMR
jgi:DNA-binding MarR family transcriptional regulator